MNNMSSIFLIVSDIATFFLDNALYFLPVTSLDIVLDIDSRYDVNLLVYQTTLHLYTVRQGLLNGTEIIRAFFYIP